MEEVFMESEGVALWFFYPGYVEGQEDFFVGGVMPVPDEHVHLSLLHGP
jgi:hypothetical protein